MFVQTAEGVGPGKNRSRDVLITLKQQSDVSWNASSNVPLTLIFLSSTAGMEGWGYFTDWMDERTSLKLSWFIKKVHHEVSQIIHRKVSIC